MTRLASSGIGFLIAAAALVPVAARGNFEPETAGHGTQPPQFFEIGELRFSVDKGRA